MEKKAAKSFPAGIDLGARYAKIAIKKGSSVLLARNRWGERFTSAIVARGSKGWLVGAEAKQLFIRFPESAWWGVTQFRGALRRPFAKGYNNKWKLEESLMPLLLSLREDAEVELGQIVSSCAIAVPLQLSFLEKNAVEMAAKKAGFEEVAFVDKAIASALSAGLDGKFLVVNVGAISTRASIVIVEEGERRLVESSSIHIGGADFDIPLARYLWDKVCRDHLDEEDPRWRALLFQAEELKETLSFVERAQWFPVAAGFPNAREIAVSRGDIAHLYLPLVEPILKLCEPLWRRHGMPQVILVGGESRLPALRAQITARLSKPIPLRFPPEEAEAVGALLKAQESQKESAADLVVSDLGIVAADGDAALILKRGAVLPAEAERRFAAMGGGKINVYIVEGKPNLVQREIVGNLTIEAVDGEEVTVKFFADADGTLTASVFGRRELLARGHFRLSRRTSDFSGRDEDIRALRAKIGNLPEIAPHHRRRLEGLLSRLKGLEESDERFWEEGVSLLENTISRIEG